MSVHADIFNGRSFIIVHGDAYGVDISGSPKEKESISVVRKDDGLIITQKQSDTNDNITGRGNILSNIFGSNNHIFISDMVINGNSVSNNERRSTLDVVVTVPSKNVAMTLNINGYYQDITICDAGDMDINNGSSSSLFFSNAGDVQINMSGSGNISGGSVKNLKISVMGSGNVSVMDTQGCAKINLQGSGDVKIKNGNMTDVDVNIMGSGDVKIKGAINGEIVTNVMGSGNIKIKVDGNMPDKIKKRSMGSGNIKIKSL